MGDYIIGIARTDTHSSAFLRIPIGLVALLSRSVLVGLIVGLIVRTVIHV